MARPPHLHQVGPSAIKAGYVPGSIGSVSLKSQRLYTISEGAKAQRLVNPALVCPLAIGIKQAFRLDSTHGISGAFILDKLRHLIRLHAPTVSGLFAAFWRGERTTGHHTGIGVQRKVQDARQLCH